MLTMGSAPALAAGYPHQRLRAPLDGGYDSFGDSVAISGSYAAVGAPQEDTTGAAYVYTRASSGRWRIVATLTPDGATGDIGFGTSVAIAGRYAVVGAPFADSFQGEAFVFVRSAAGTWSQQAVLTASDAQDDVEIGTSVAIDGSTVVIGDHTDEVTSAMGLAYVYSRNGSSWTQEAELAGSDGPQFDNDPDAVTIGHTSLGQTIVVGVGDDESNGRDGAVYVFTEGGGGWSEQAEVVPSNPSFQQFGEDVALSDDTLIAGAPYADTTKSESGAAYVFTLDGSTWTQTTEIRPITPRQSAGFGWPVACRGGRAYVGAINRPHGAVYEFTRSRAGWTQTAMVTGPPVFGEAIAEGATSLLIGSPSADTSGAVFAYGRPL